MEALKKDKAITILNRIMELELAGVVRYTHYSLMIYGYNRIPIVGWAAEGLAHAQRAGELITQTLGKLAALAGVREFPMRVKCAMAAAVRLVEGITAVRVELVWEPPWSIAMMSEAARLQLGIL